MFYARRTSHKIMDHMDTKYNKLTIRKIKKNDILFWSPYDVASNMETFFDCLHKCADILQHKGAMHSKSQVLENAYGLIYTTHLYYKSCKAWDNIDLANKDWAGFKGNFQDKEYQLKRCMAGDLGYANRDMEEPVANVTFFNEAAEVLTNLANATSIGRENMLV